MTTKKEAAEEVRAAKVRLGLTWAQLAKAVGRPNDIPYIDHSFGFQTASRRSRGAPLAPAGLS
jgi:hypothetical protein